MGAPYRLYTAVSAGYNASIYYRVLLPFHMMEKLGFPVETIVDFGESDIPEQTRNALLLESDISLAYQTTSKFRLAMMQQAKTLKPMTDHEGHMRWPATFVVDTDDDLFNVQPLNMSFGRYGIRKPTGEPMEDGDEIGIAHPIEVAPPGAQDALNKQFPAAAPGDRGELEGQRFIYSKDGKWHVYFSLWKDGRNMDLNMSRASINAWKDIMAAANLVTCSTPNAEAYVKREAGIDTPTFVSPNAIDQSVYPFVELADHPGEVRIMWQGSSTHHEDLWPLNEAISRVAAKYPQTTWLFWGAPYKWAKNNIPADRVKLVPWVAYDAYTTRLSTMNHDINLAPLVPHIFNLSRSAIKWYESSAICKPAATLAQNTGAYAAEIQDGETGLLFNNTEEFETKLGGLIEDATLRQRLAANAKDWVLENRDARKVISALWQKYMEAREGHKLSMPMPEEPESAITSK